MHELEREAKEILVNFIRENADTLKHLSSWGDGRCGYIAEVFCSELGIEDHSKSSVQYRPMATKRQKKILIESYGGACMACGSIKDITVDHVQPVSKNGSNEISNMQLLCRSCNSSKGVRNTDYRAVVAV